MSRSPSAQMFTSGAESAQPSGTLTMNSIINDMANKDVIFFAGIFAYLNYLTPKSRKEILELLVNGLKRLEYRGYDSAGDTLCFVSNAFLIVFLLCCRGCCGQSEQ